MIDLHHKLKGALKKKENPSITSNRRSLIIINNKKMTVKEKGKERKAAEVKFLIHDLRVKKFIDDIIHFHATLNTDLEIHNIEQAQMFHGQDLQELKLLASQMRRSYNLYRNTVKTFASNTDIIQNGTSYILKVQEICELVLNPLWGRFDRVIAFLPETSRSYQSRTQYRNYLRWICNVYYRIDHFFQELNNQHHYEEFDVADDIYAFTNNVIHGYVTENSSSTVEIVFEKFDSAVIGGNRPRFRRMYFNLVKNAVDAMQNKQNGQLIIRVFKEGDYVYLSIQDNGTGMTKTEAQNLLSKKQSLEGKLHLIGFVFVQQTIKMFNGNVSIESNPGKGAMITLGFPYLEGKTRPKIKKSKCEKYFNFKTGNEQENVNIKMLDKTGKINISNVWNSCPIKQSVYTHQPDSNKDKQCGLIIYNDYKKSEASIPGCVFAISVNYKNTLDFFTHKPYEKDWDLSHEDLSPMFFESTIRGRLETNDQKKLKVILKAPHSKKDFFYLKDVTPDERCTNKYKQLIHDEYILIARKFLNSGMPSFVDVQISEPDKFFNDPDLISKSKPFPIEILADQKLSIE
ncbi:MAG: ATP-binding protein [Deltaproteobacteria bacterium]|nr:ATP-binding protein [Deltaproteobacteria bacterium]MBT4525730.1 ATP-binding protein [Deltaproteobacteria bacterium]